MKKRTSGLGVVLDFYFLEMVAPYRSGVALRTFQSTIYILYACFLPALLTLALVAFLVIKPLLAERPGAASAVLVIFLVGNLYLAASYLLREIFSERRFVVANSGNAAFYRAFDIRAWDVFIIYSGLRTTAFYLAVLVVDAAFVAVFNAAGDVPGPGLPIALALPVAAYLLTLAVSAAVAGSGTRSKVSRPPALASSALAMVAIGYGTARFVIGPVVDEGPANAFTRDDVTLLISGIAVAAPIIGVGSLLALGVGARRLIRCSFPIRAVDAPVEAPIRWWANPGRWNAAFCKMRILHRELTRSKVYPLVRKNFLILSAALLLCLGASASGARVLPVGGFAERFGVTYQGVAFVSFIVLVALIFTVVGPTTFAAQFRLEWENLLLSRRHIATSAAVYYVLPAALLGCGFAALLALAAGRFSVGPVALAVSVAAAAMIAESTVTPREMADGSTAQGTIAALVVLLLGSPTFAAVSRGSALFDLLAVAYSLCLLAGGVACMFRRIQTLPSRSAI